MLRRAVCSLASSSHHFASYFPGCFLDSCVQASGYMLSGLDVFLIFAVSHNPFVPFRKSCTLEMVSCGPSPLLRKIDTPRFVPHVIDTFFTDNLCCRLSLSHHVDVFQWDRKCFIICFVKLSSRFFMMSTNKIHTWTTNLLLCFPFCHLPLRSQHLLARGFPLLLMVVWDDQEV